jgi:alpha-L-rhamnosidase
MPFIPAVGNIIRITARLLGCTLAVILFAAAVGYAQLLPKDLRCEYLKDPLGIDVVRPRLSWKLQSANPAARGELQAAYQLQAASTRAGLASAKPDLWDSGKVNSDQSHLVEYAGEPLASRMQGWWRVRVWDAKGNASNWSEPAMWSMGLLRPEDWTAKWIGLDGGEEIRPAWEGAQWIWAADGAAAQASFRRKISVPETSRIKSATMSLIASGGFVLYVNGKEAGKGIGPISPEHVAKFDITEQVHAGEDIVAVAARGEENKVPGFIGEVRITFAEGAPLMIPTGKAWKVSAQPEKGWDSAAFDASAWPSARELGPHGSGPWPRLVDDERRLPARMLRHEFKVEPKVRRATAYVSGLGLYEFYLNGAKVGDHVMDPVQSRYDKRSMYVTYDVTPLLKPGPNAAGVILGNGRFFAPRLHVPVDTLSFGYPKLRFQLEIEYADGRTATVASDASWRVTADGPIRSNNEFDGEEYDARMEQPGWASPGFNDAKWQPAQEVSAPGGVLISQMVEPMRVTQILRPVAVTQPKSGVTVVDFGQNYYGVVRLRLRGPAGTRVQMRTAFPRKPDGTVKMEDNRSARSTDVYILKGKGEEIWSPRFRGQGMRYAELTDFPGVPSAANFEGLVIHTDMDQEGEFTTSNQLINRIYQNVRWSIRMQQRGVPLDPDRDERQAWLGTSIKSSESEGWMYNVAPFYRNFLAETRIDQREDGNLSDGGSIWPFYRGDPIWPTVVTIVPDWYFDFYGDRRILEENLETMKRWMQFQERTNLQPDFTVAGVAYGDWVDASSMDYPLGDKTSGATSKLLMGTAFFYRSCLAVARAAGLLGKAEDQQYYESLAEKVKAGFNRRFLNAAKGTYESETQCAYVLALAFGLVPEDVRAAVARNLVDDIMIKHQGHLSVGFVGMQYFMQVLTDIGHPEVAYTVATQTTRPSWGYMISKGATSVWERWDTNTQDPGMNGESQCILSGNLAAWFYQTLGGINYDPKKPGFKHIVLRPRPVGDLKFVKSWHESPYGRIDSNWKIENGMLHWRFTVPPNTTATVEVPGDAARITESGKPVASMSGVRQVGTEKDAVVYEVGSGNYTFVSPIAGGIAQLN